MASLAISSSESFHNGSVSLQKYSRPIQTLPGVPTSQGLQLLKICSRPTATSGS